MNYWTNPSQNLFRVITNTIYSDNILHQFGANTDDELNLN